MEKERWEIIQNQLRRFAVLLHRKAAKRRETVSGDTPLKYPNRPRISRYPPLSLPLWGRGTARGPQMMRSIVWGSRIAVDEVCRLSDIEIHRVFRVILDEFTSGFDLVAHEDGENFIASHSVLDIHA